MAEGFLGGLSRQLTFWSGWVFTVGGAGLSLGLGKEYAWIGVLCVVAGLIALMGFAYQKHRDLRQAQEAHRAITRQLEAEIRAARERAENAERRLNEIPADILLRLEATIQSNAFDQLAAALGKHADYVARMVEMARILTRPIALRTFVRRAGTLYVDARLDATAIGQLRQDDPYLLEFKNPSGLVTASAVLRCINWRRRRSLSGFRWSVIEATRSLTSTPWPKSKKSQERATQPARFVSRRVIRTRMLPA
jgi:hypothetical protein